MRATYLALCAAFAGLACGACPFSELKRSGVLSEDDIAQFEAVKRNPKAAEALVKAHQAEKREAAAEPNPASIVGPILNGVLDLPLGGGLRKCPIPQVVYAPHLTLQ